MARVYENGGEYPTVAQNRLAVAGGASVSTSANTFRLDPNGNGGARSLRCFNGNYRTSPCPYGLTRAWWRFASYNTTAAGSTATYYELYSGATASTIRIGVNAANFWEVRVNGVVVISGPAYVVSTYQRLELYSKIGASAAGNLEFKVDGVSYGTSSVATNGAVAAVDCLLQLTANGFGDVYTDDIAINSPDTVLFWDGAAGTTPTAGQTVTSGAKTATILYVNAAAARSGVAAGVTGYLIIANTGTTFADNDALAVAAAGWTANANGAELAPNVSWCGEGFIRLLLPSASGTTSGLTNSAGTSVNNYTYVDDLETTADYVQGATAGLFDTYNFTDLDTTQYAVINSMMTCFHQVKTDDVVPTISAEFRIGVTNYADAVTLNATAASQWVSNFVYQNPGTLAAWTIAGLNGAEAGPRVD